MHKIFDHLKYQYLSNYTCNCEINHICHYDQYCREDRNTLRQIVRIYCVLENIKYLNIAQKCIRHNKHFFETRVDIIKVIFSRIKLRLTF